MGKSWNVIDKSFGMIKTMRKNIVKSFAITKFPVLQNNLKLKRISARGYSWTQNRFNNWTSELKVPL